MEFLVRSEALPADRIIGVQTGGCPHTAIREDASMNFDALDELTAAVSRSRSRVSGERRRQPRRQLQPGAGRRLDLRDRRLGRRQDPAQGRPRRHAIGPAGHQQDRSGGSHVGANLEVMARDARLMRGDAPVRLHQPEGPDRPRARWSPGFVTSCCTRHECRRRFNGSLAHRRPVRRSLQPVRTPSIDPDHLHYPIDSHPLIPAPASAIGRAGQVGAGLRLPPWPDGARARLRRAAVAGGQAARRRADRRR